MTSSGMKRGLAAVAVSALAVTGLPALAGTANATPIATTFADADDIAFYSQNVAGISDKNDGTNTTVSLVTGGGSNVTSVLYQYEVSTGAGTWVDVPGGLVGRNADGVFAFDWAGVPDTVTRVRAVPNTGLGNAVTVVAPTVLPDATAHTVELASEGSLGVFQEPYTETAGTQELLAVTGTVSDPVAVDVTDVSHGTTGVAADVTVTNDGVAGTTETFDAVVDIDGYPYSAGTDANQIALNAATDNTDDAEGSTLYVQQIGSITATPETQERANAGDSVITLTVKDTAGKPVAGAQVGIADLDTDCAGPDTDAPDTILGTTDGKGQLVDSSQTTAGTFTYFVNTTDVNEYEPGTDPADTATVTTYTPKLTTVDIVNERNRSNFDIDELSDSDDFTILTQDQRGNAINEDLAAADVEYRWVIDPAGAATAVTSPWIPAETGANGKAIVVAPTDANYATWSGTASDLPEGSYTIEARRPNVSGAGLTNATPETFAASESEITYDEGASANAPVNGSFTVDGNLSNDGGGLAGREVHLTYTPGTDSSLAPQAQQPAGVTVTGANTATVITDANGDFSVALRDPAIPANVTPVPENGTLNAEAYEAKGDPTSLQGNLGPNDSTVANDADNAEQDLVIHWAKAATPAKVTLTTHDLFGFENDTPGRPVDFDVLVEDAAGADLTDFPVEVTVDHGFVTPGAGNGASADADNLTPDPAPVAGANYGEWKDLGATETVSTGDAASADFAAAIERDAGFDDDGLVNTTVTVKAGTVTKTYTVNWNSSDPLNPGSVELVPVAGESTTATPGQTVEFNVFAKDQFGNLVGNEQVQIFDNTTAADFSTDYFGGYALSDFSNSGASVIASSGSAVSQVLEARWNNASDNYTNANGDHARGNETVTDTATVTWTGRKHIQAELTLKNQADGDDVAKVNAPAAAAGATVKLFKIKKDGTRVLLATKTANAKGNAKFVVNDTKPGKATTYKAKVGATAKTFADWTPKRTIK